MPVKVTKPTRIFKFNDQELADPNPAMSPGEVASFYASQMPELTTAAVKGPSLDDDKMVYEFSTSIGTKG